MPPQPLPDAAPQMIVWQSLDMFLVGNVVVSFLIFLVLQIVIFRFVERQSVLRWLIYVFLMALAGNIVGSLVYILQKHVLTYFGLGGALVTLLIPAVALGLFCFCYVLCIFGPYESSIRLRILREVHTHGINGINYEEFLKYYNADTILKIRLARLVAAGDLTFNGVAYQSCQRHNVFSLISVVSDFLRWAYRLEESPLEQENLVR